ncbi:uncharacterized protein N7515_001931 [Penicillium bovifimosum]|uniref:Uncharacterized protein n=1 Tax=Penicillium bovifimosum TaxID=126998 RepID=A0A9W9L967_9EURO|nr:uncharacterized protein N7515_001931 [Penicillium bovifimosum]KAJ5143144.1 hypothetical protein N7515_001931 [Penicillium bovifimosum]
MGKFNRPKQQKRSKNNFSLQPTIMCDEEEQHLPLRPISLASSADSFVSIPEHLISLATLEHLGYNTETARRIWQHWCKLPSGEPGSTWEEVYKDVPFIEVAQGHIDHLMDTCDLDDAQWTHCMDLYGVNSELQQAIMDPKFRQYRLTESCKTIPDIIESYAHSGMTRRGVTRVVVSHYSKRIFHFTLTLPDLFYLLLDHDLEQI